MINSYLRHAEPGKIPDRVSFLVPRYLVVGAPDGDRQRVAEDHVGLDLAGVRSGERGGVLSIGAVQENGEDNKEKDPWRCCHLVSQDGTDFFSGKFINSVKV